MNTRALKRAAPLPPAPRLVLLALFFLAGVLLGQVLAERVPDGTGTELRRYLEDYLRLGAEPSAGTAVSAAVIYFRYPLAAFLLGFATIGALLLPAVSMAFGFFLSFSVCCFTATFGGAGVLLALAVFGLRCLVTDAAGGRWRRLGVCCLALAGGVCAELMLSPWLLRLLLERLLA